MTKSSPAYLYQGSGQNMTLCKFADGDLCKLLFDLNISSVDVSYKARQIKNPARHIDMC